jgi:acetyl esterase
MELKPDVAKAVAAHYAAKLKPVSECASPQEARDSFAARLKRFREQAGDIPVGAVKDIEIPSIGCRIRARCYWPKSEAVGIIVFFHGGGFVIGSIDTHDHSARNTCLLSQAIVVSVDYRKAPEHPYPAAVEDAIEATRWACRNAESLAGRDVPVAVCGLSSGGTLAAVVALEARKESIEVAAQFLIYPQTDSASDHPSMDESAEGYIFTKRDSKWFNEHYCRRARNLDRESKRSPIYATEVKDLPPALVATAAFDPLRDEGIAYAAKLASAGNRVLLLSFDGTVHGFFGFGADVPSAQRDTAQICAAMRTMLEDTGWMKRQFG